MSLGLIKPGASATLHHPKTGAILAPLGYTKAGKAIMPILGASSDDEDDPAFTGGDSDPVRRPRRKPDEDDDLDDPDDDESDEDEEDDDEDDKKSKKSTKDEDSRPHRQAARYRTQLRDTQRELAELKEQMRKAADEGKPADELLKRDLAEATERNTTLAARVDSLAKENAFLRSNDVQWHDPADVLKLIDFDEIDVDEDGTVDARQLRRALRDLAKRKPHLVKKSGGRAQDDEDDNDEEPRSRSSAPAMNGSRRGKQKTGTDRASLAKRFPVLGR